jgi:hypothetical protein
MNRFIETALVPTCWGFLGAVLLSIILNFARVGNPGGWGRRHPHPVAGLLLLHIMIQIFLCKLTDGEWRRVERYHVGRGFALMSEAVEYAETLNRQRWPSFDWIREPTEAYLAILD